MCLIQIQLFCLGMRGVLERAELVRDVFKLKPPPLLELMTEFPYGLQLVMLVETFELMDDTLSDFLLEQTRLLKYGLNPLNCSFFSFLARMFNFLFWALRSSNTFSFCQNMISFYFWSAEGFLGCFSTFNRMTAGSWITCLLL